MSLARRLSLIVVVTALAVLAVVAFVRADQPGGLLAGHADDDASQAAGRAPGDAPPLPPTTSAPAALEPTDPTADPTDDPSDDPTADPTTPAPDATPDPGPQPGPALLTSGDRGPKVRDLQARLRQLDWFQTDVTGTYGPVTEEAVRGFQGKRGFPATGEVDRRTLDRIHQMSTTPTADELANRYGLNVNRPGALDPRCSSGRAICVDKTTRTLRWVVDGKVLKTLDVRFGASYSPTREGAFTIGYKSRDHVSHLYGSAMPFAMFFSGGQAVHYSSDFAARGYSGASHGCVNVRDYDGVRWLFDHTRVGDKVIVYWS